MLLSKFNVFIIFFSLSLTISAQLGTEFQISDAASSSDVSADSLGNFAAVWTTYIPSHVSLRRYSRLGIPIGEIISIAQPSDGYKYSGISMRKDGSFAVAYLNSPNIYLNIYDNNGEIVASNITVTNNASDGKIGIAYSNANTIIVSWKASSGIHAAVFNNIGEAIGADFIVHIESQYSPDASIFPNGDFLLTWTGSISGIKGIVAQRYSKYGAPIGEPNFIQAYDSQLAYPSIGISPTGRYGVVYQSQDIPATSEGWDIYCQRFNSDDSKFGTPIRINEYLENEQSFPKVQMDDKDNIYFVWQSSYQLGLDKEIYFKKISFFGESIISETRVNTTITGSQKGPSFALASNGDFIITWEGSSFSGTYVKNSNYPPELVQSLEDTVIEESSGKHLITENLNIYYSDPDGDTLTFSTSVVNGGITSQIQDDSLFINTIADTVGHFLVIVSASDIEYTTSDTFQVSVQPINPAPQLISPDSGSVNQATPLLFVWNYYKHAEEYNFQISFDDIFTNIVTDTTTSDTTFNISSLNGNTKYYWRVKLYNTFGESSWSEVWNLTTIVDTPTVVVLQSPANNSEGNVEPITLIWNKSNLAESYKLQLSTDINFTTTLLDSSGIIDTNNVLDELNNLTMYYWRVKATNTGGSSEWSEVWSFKTLGEPSTVLLINPPDSSINQPINLEFVWSKASDNKLSSSKHRVNTNESNGSIMTVSNYWFELSSDTEFIIDSTLTDTTKLVSGLSNYTDYNWRVKAKNETGWGAYSSWSKFTTIVDTPSIAVLKSPLNNSDRNVLPIAFTWEANKSAESYEIEVCKDASFGPLVADSSGITDTTYTIDEFGISTDYTSKHYYWRVRAVNSAEKGEWSEVWMIHDIVTVPTLIIPENNSEKVDSMFMWSYIENADYYTLQISDSRTFDSLFLDIHNIESIDYFIYDNELFTGICYWRVRGENEAGVGAWSDTFAVSIITDIEALDDIIPQEYVLHQNYPNPFNPSTTLKYEIPKESYITLKVYDILGREVATLVNQQQKAGYYEVDWNAVNNSSGIYFYRIQAGDFVETKKMVLMK